MELRHSSTTAGTLLFSTSSMARFTKRHCTCTFGQQTCNVVSCIEVDQTEEPEYQAHVSMCPLLSFWSRQQRTT